MTLPERVTMNVNQIDRVPCDQQSRYGLPYNHIPQKSEVCFQSANKFSFIFSPNSVGLPKEYCSEQPICNTASFTPDSSVNLQTFILIR